MTLLTVLGQLHDAISVISGINDAPEYPPNEPKDYPFLVLYPWDFTSEMNTPEDYKTLWNIRVELHVARNDLSADVLKALGYAESIPTALLKACVTNAIANAGLTGQFAQLGWNEVQTVGFAWLLRDVKVLTNLS